LQALRSLHGVMTDIDDTLTRDGQIEPTALQALHALHAAGLPVIAIKDAAWREALARFPVSAE
jgi:ribonucleotide monophosphatase NagD (HAD superfamily)